MFDLGPPFPASLPPVSPLRRRPGGARGWCALALALALATATGCANLTQRDRDASSAGPADTGGSELEVEVITLRLAYNNVHALRFAERTVLIDAGTEADAPKLERRLRAAGVDPAGIVAVVLTHGHADHAGGAGWLRERYGVAIVAGAGDTELLAGGHNDRLCPSDRQGRKRLAANQAARFTPITPDYTITTASDLGAVLGLPSSAAPLPPIRVVPLPGHTAGSLVIVVGERAFVGDLFRGQIAGSGAERHFYMCDPEANDADVRTLLTELAPASSEFFVGHFGPVSRAAVEARWLASEDRPGER